MNKITTGALAVASAFALSMASWIAPANADPVITVNAGTHFAPSLDGQTANGTCTITAAGVDSHGNKVAETAGHCGAGNKYAVTDSGQLLGTFETVVTNYSGFYINGLDYSFIKLADNVVVNDPSDALPNIKQTAPAQEWKQVCKFGHGIVNGGERCALTTNVSANPWICTTLPITPGDSGGPVYYKNDKSKLIGLVSGYLSPCGFLVAIDQQSIESDATARGGVGAGFQVQA